MIMGDTADNKIQRALDEYQQEPKSPRRDHKQKLWSVRRLADLWPVLEWAYLLADASRPPCVCVCPNVPVASNSEEQKNDLCLLA